LILHPYASTYFFGNPESVRWGKGRSGVRYILRKKCGGARCGGAHRKWTNLRQGSTCSKTKEEKIEFLLNRFQVGKNPIAKREEGPFCGASNAIEVKD